MTKIEPASDMLFHTCQTKENVQEYESKYLVFLTGIRKLLNFGERFEYVLLYLSFINVRFALI
jgi:hypothetical protein